MWGTLLTESPSKGWKAWTCSELNQRTSWFRGTFREGRQGAQCLPGGTDVSKLNGSWQGAEGTQLAMQTGSADLCPIRPASCPAPSPQLWLRTAQLDLRSPFWPSVPQQTLLPRGWLRAVLSPIKASLSALTMADIISDVLGFDPSLRVGLGPPGWEQSRVGV